MRVARIPLALCLILVATAFAPRSSQPSFHPATTYHVFAEPQSGSAPLVSLIDSARHSIRVEVYEFTDSDVFDALERAQRRHVSVEVILEEHPLGSSRYATEAYDRLRRARIQVKWANESRFTYTHEKALVVDGKTAGIFTFNFSYSAMTSNREFGVIDNAPKDAAAVGRVFKADWKRQRAPILHDPGIVVSPINSRSALYHLVDGAHHTLHLYEEEIADSGFESHLIRAVHRHVDVRLITSDRSSGVKYLHSHGVKVVVLSNPYIHAKAILADGTRLFIGSENVSTTSLDDNREMGIILKHGIGAGVFKRVFRHDWKSG